MLITLLAALAQPTPPLPPGAVDVPAVPEAPALPTVPSPTDIPSVATPPRPPAIPSRASAAATRDEFGMNEVVDITDEVPDNAFLMGREVNITAPIGGDVFSMAETVVIDQPIAGDVYAMGATVRVTETGSIGGNLTVFAGELVLNGPVGGSLRAEVGELTLTAPIAGNASLSTERLTLESTAHIAGDLDYRSSAPFPALEQATAGEVEHTLELPELQDTDTIAEEDEEPGLIGQAVWWSGMRVWGYVTKFLVGALLLFVGGSWLGSAGRRIHSEPGKALGVGAVTLAVVPLLSTLALITVVPFPLGLLGLSVFAILLYIGQLFAAQALGDVLLRRFQPDALGAPWISLAVGLVPLMLLMALPWVGSLVWLVATVFGIGGLVNALRGIR